MKTLTKSKTGTSADNREKSREAVQLVKEREKEPEAPKPRPSTELKDFVVVEPQKKPETYFLLLYIALCFPHCFFLLLL